MVIKLPDLPGGERSLRQFSSQALRGALVVARQRQKTRHGAVHPDLPSPHRLQDGPLQFLDEAQPSAHPPHGPLQFLGDLAQAPAARASVQFLHQGSFFQGVPRPTALHLVHPCQRFRTRQIPHLRLGHVRL